MRTAVSTCALMIAAAMASRAHAAPLSSTLLYSLSDTTGTLPYSWATVSWDAHANELYVVSAGLVDIFNDNGMSVHHFANDTGSGFVTAAVSVGNGDIYVLTGGVGTWALIRCNYRGEPQAQVEITGLPADFAFTPTALAEANDKLYLADRAQMRLAVVGLDGKVLQTRDFITEIGVDPKHKDDALMRSFSVDRDGNVLFTVSALFSAYVATPDGKVRSFGMKGSAPGRFNVVSGIAADESGHLYVADTLRAAVMVFDATDFTFLGEFGQGEVRSPLNVAAAGGKVFVTQSRGGIRVFGVQFE